MTGFVGRHNVYGCPECGRAIVTIDRHEGVTSSHLACRATAGCKGTSVSGWYPHSAANLEPEWEWYQPDRAGRRRLDGPIRDHVERGGLMLRRIDTGRDPLVDPDTCRCPAPALLDHMPHCPEASR